MLTEIIIVYVYLVIQMIAVWGFYRLLKNPGVVDVSWAIGLMIAGLIYMTFAPPGFRTEMIVAVLILWGARLSGYLYYTRIRPNIVEKRYLKISENWKISQSLGFFLNFQLQALLILIMSCVFLFAADTAHLNPTILDYVGLIIAVTGIIGEAITDWQLYKFQKTSKEKVCNRGLWNYSRHPNYYFEWVTWCGFTLFGLQAHLGWIGIISPLTLYLLMTLVTGPITERGSIASRGQAYLDYQRTTSMFFPWFKFKK